MPNLIASPDGYLTQIGDDARETLRVYEGPNSKTALVTFASFCNPGLSEPSFAYLNSALRARKLHSLPCDIYYFLSHGNDWYLPGLRGLAGGSLPEAAQSLTTFLQRKPYERQVFIGNSMGGYAALAMGAMCHASEVIAFSPQTRFDLPFYNSIRETRWQAEFSRLRAEYDVDAFRVRNIIENAGGDTAYRVFAGLKRNQDVAYAKDLENMENVELTFDENSGHNLVLDFRADGRLEDILRMAGQAL